MVDAITILKVHQVLRTHTHTHESMEKLGEKRILADKPLFIWEQLLETPSFVYFQVLLTFFLGSVFFSFFSKGPSNIENHQHEVLEVHLDLASATCSIF